MRNLLLLGLFFLGLGTIYAMYFIPNIRKENNIDQIESALENVKQTVPPSAKVYFLTETDIKINPEIYFKVQFALAPRVVIAEKYSNVPTGNYMVRVQDKINSKIPPVAYPFKDALYETGNKFFEISLLKKTP